MGNPPPQVESTRPLRVVIVDDDDLVRAAASRMIERVPDVVVERYALPVAALARLCDPAAPPVDVVMVDREMPAMDGVALVRELRGAGLRMLVAFVTGAPGGLESAARELECSIIPKPLSRAAATALLAAARESVHAAASRSD